MNLRPEFLSPLRTLTGIDSPSGDAEGVTKAGDVMEGIFRNLGWETDRPEVGSYGRACVFRNHPLLPVLALRAWFKAARWDAEALASGLVLFCFAAARRISVSSRFKFHLSHSNGIPS